PARAAITGESLGRQLEPCLDDIVGVETSSTPTRGVRMGCRCGTRRGATRTRCRVAASHDSGARAQRVRRSLCPQRGWYHPVDGCTYTLGGETGFPASGALARFIAGDDVVRIEWIEIDGFGHFAGRTFGPLARGITIIHGPNEAGKSTLHAFIRAILFGFPAPDAPEWIPAPAGELHGGRLVLRDGAGARIVVERHRDRCGGAARVTCEGGPDGGEEALRELLGNIGSDAYRSIFAFGVGDLCALDPCLLGALSGSDLVPGDRQLHRPKDNGPPVAEILRELEALDRELFIARLPGDSDLRDRRAEVARQ